MSKMIEYVMHSQLIIIMTMSMIMIISVFQTSLKISRVIGRGLQCPGPYVRKIKIELCSVCSRGHSAGHFGTKIKQGLSSKRFDGVILNSVIQNMHYEKLNLSSKLISPFYIQLHSTVKT